LKKKEKKLIRKKLCRTTVPNILAMLVETKKKNTPYWRRKQKRIAFKAKHLLSVYLPFSFICAFYAIQHVKERSEPFRDGQFFLHLLRCK